MQLIFEWYIYFNKPPSYKKGHKVNCNKKHYYLHGGNIQDYCLCGTNHKTDYCFVVLSNNRLLPVWYYNKMNYCLCCAAIFLDCTRSNFLQTHANNLKIHISVSVKFMEELYGMLYYNSSQAYMFAIQTIHCIAYSLE